MQQHKQALGCAWCGGQCEYNSVCEKSASNEACPGPEVASVSNKLFHWSVLT